CGRTAEGDGRGIEVPGQHSAGGPVDRRAPPAGARGHGLPEREGLDARLDAHREDFGQSRLHDVTGAVVDELGDRARADRPDVVRLIADRVEYGLQALEEVLVAADPEGEPARLGAARAAAHGRVEHVDTLL